MRQVTLACLLALSACQVGPPKLGCDENNITLKQAMVGVVDSLAAAQLEGRAKNVVLGLNPCTVTVVFNIAATGVNHGEVGLSAGTPTTAPVSVSAQGAAESSVTRYLGNTVTLVLASPECVKAGAAGGGGAKKDDSSGGSEGSGGSGSGKGTKPTQHAGLPTPPVPRPGALPPIPPTPPFVEYKFKGDPTIFDPPTDSPGK
jgi:hypothetical protein